MIIFVYYYTARLPSIYATVLRNCVVLPSVSLSLSLSFRPVQTHKSRTETSNLVKHATDVPIFEQKGQRSMSNGPTEFANRQRVISSKKSAAKMTTLSFSCDVKQTSDAHHH